MYIRFLQEYRVTYLLLLQGELADTMVRESCTYNCGIDSQRNKDTCIYNRRDEEGGEEKRESYAARCVRKRKVGAINRPRETSLSEIKSSQTIAWPRLLGIITNERTARARARRSTKDYRGCRSECEKLRGQEEIGSRHGTRHLL